MKPLAVLHIERLNPPLIDVCSDEVEEEEELDSQFMSDMDKQKLMMMQDGLLLYVFNTYFLHLYYICYNTFICYITFIHLYVIMWAFPI